MGEVISIVARLRRDRARRLRRAQTEAEDRLWRHLRAGRRDGWKWRRQTPIGPFVVDFLCPWAWLVVELDGGVHALRTREDARRDAYLRRHGLTVLRFTNTRVSTDRDRVLWTILQACRESDPSRRGRHIDHHRRPRTPT